MLTTTYAPPIEGVTRARGLTEDTLPALMGLTGFLFQCEKCKAVMTKQLTGKDM